MSFCIEQKVAQIRANFESLIEKQTEDAVWARDKNALGAAKQKLKFSYDSLEFFNTVVKAPPPGMELTFFPVGRKNAEQNERAIFSLSVKRDFLRAICRESENFTRLRQMNVSLRDAQEMRTTGRVPRDHNGIPLYDITFDHIHEIQIGGKTTPDNLCLLPRGLNLLKGTFIRVQIAPHWPQEISDDNLILGLAPQKVNGAYPKVPLIEGGYGRPCVSGRKNRAIEESLTVHASLI